MMVSQFTLQTDSEMAFLSTAFNGNLITGLHKLFTGKAHFTLSGK